MNETKRIRTQHFRGWVLAGLMLLLPWVARAQDTMGTTKQKMRRNLLVGAFYGYGYVFRSGKFVEGDNAEHRPINHYQSFSARIIFQNSGNKKAYWYKYYQHPYLGVGVNVADFFDVKEMGFPIAIYGFINGPFHRWNKLSFNYEIDLGLTGNWRHFNPETNPYNVAIGAERTVFIHLGIGLSYRFLPHWEADFNVGVEHFSNGAIKVPNYGLNLLTPRLEMRYSIHGAPRFKDYEVPPFRKMWSLNITPFGGVKNVVNLDSVQVNPLPDYQGVYLPVIGLRTTLNWQISPKSKFGLGMAFTYDGSEGYSIAVENNNMFLKPLPFLHAFRVSIYPSYELVIGPFSLIFQPAFYLYREHFEDQVPVFYQRIGFQYTLARKVTFGVSLRAYRFQVSEFIEWSIGYQLNWPKK